MPRWTETWLSGLESTGTSAYAEGDWRGRRLGLPEDGPGALAGTGARVTAFAVDSLSSGFVAALFFTDPVDSRRGLLGVAILAVEYILLTALTGQTFGMRLMRLRTVTVRGDAPVPGFLAACIRTALLLLLIPALISDRDRRGLHDRAAGTVVVDAGRKPRAQRVS